MYKGVVETGRFERAGKAVNLMKGGEYVGIGWAVGDTALIIRDACHARRTDVCKQARYIETGKLALSVGGASAGGALTAYAATGMCAVVFAIPSFGAGALGCAIVGGAVGGYYGGETGQSAGERIGELLYEVHN